jgi:DNA-binding SARP family transcriptional activator
MIRVRTLGQCTIQIDSSHITPDAEIVFASLLLLTVERGRRVERSELLGMLWPDVSASRASHCLRQTIYRLRTLGAPLAVERTQLVLSERDVECDVDALLRVSRTDDIEEAADRVAGPFLPGYSPRFSEPLRDWVEHQRDRVNAGARRVLVSAIAARRARGEWAHVERLAHQCLAIDPLNEEATLALAEAAALHGGKVEAVGILDRYLREMGPSARELRLPAVALRRRISEPECEFPLAPPLHVPFVGRGAEMATLTAALRSAQSGFGAVYFIHGEPGIGKTRLLTEFTRVAVLEGARVAPAVCQSNDARRPLSAFVDLVPKLIALPGALGCSPQSNLYLRRLVQHHSSDAPPTPDTSEAVLLYANVRRSLFDLLDAIASESPLVVSIEDVQWLDPASWEIIAEATEWIQTRHMLLVLTSRDSEPRYPPSAALPSEAARSLRLEPIDRGARHALVEATLRQRRSAVTDEFREWCVDKSGGNPYYLSELALHGLRTNGEFAVPPSLTTLVGQRVANLHPASRRVLQACAILGRDATLERLEVVLQERRLELLDALDELEARGLVEWEEAAIVSRHDLLSEAAIAPLSTLSRRFLHQHTALALEQALTHGLSPSLAWSCAEHWSAAGALERGVRLVIKCARQSIEIGRPMEAQTLLQRAKTLPLSRDARMSVVAESLYANRAADCWHDARTDFAELRALYRAQNRVSAFHDDAELIGMEAEWLGGADLSLIVGEVLECCTASHAAPDHRLAAARLGFILTANLGDAETARRIYSLAAPDLENAELNLAHRTASRLIYETSFGEAQVARRELDELLSAAKAVPPRERAQLLVWAAHACERLGIVDRVSEIALNAYRLAEEAMFGTMACSAARKLAWNYWKVGDQTEAYRWHDIARSWIDRGQFSGYAGDLYGLQAELLIGDGRLAEAEKALEKATLAWSQTVNARWKSWHLATRCAIWFARGELEQVEAGIPNYRELVLSLADEGGNEIIAARFFQLLCDLGHERQAADDLKVYVAKRRSKGLPSWPGLAALVERIFGPQTHDRCRSNDQPLFEVSQTRQLPHDR